MRRFITILALCVFCLIHNSWAKSNRVLYILSDPASTTVSKQEFFLVSRFYGLPVDISIASNFPTDSTAFNDVNGQKYPCVAVSEVILEKLSPPQVANIKAYVNNGGSVFITDVSDSVVMDVEPALQSLTDGYVLGAQRRVQSEKILIFSTMNPQLTDVFTGLRLTYPTNPDTTYDQALVYNPGSGLVPIISSVDSSGQTFDFFISYPAGAGNVYISSANQRHRFHKLYTYYDVRFGPEILPSMIVLKMLYGEYAWHSSDRFANFTIDDPALANKPGLTFSDYLNNVKAHRYHTTFAYIPQSYVSGYNEPAVEQLFQTNTDYFSIVEHGDFHVPQYEFFAYTSSDSANVCQSAGYCGNPPVPFAEHERLLVDGLTKISLMEKNLGLHRNRVMVFPAGSPPVPTLGLLDKYDFNATMNGQQYPLLITNDTVWNSDILPVNIDYEAFPYYDREYVIEPYDSIHIRSHFEYGIFNLFIGKPALYFGHVVGLPPNSTGFNLFADSLNRLAIHPNWKGCDYIASHIYTTKTNEDGSDSVIFYGNDVVLTNPTPVTKMIYAQKTVGTFAAIRSVLIDNLPVPFTTVNGILNLNLSINSNSSREITIVHSQGSLDFAISPADVKPDPLGLKIMVHNFGDSAGVCSAVLMDSSNGEVIGVNSGIVNGHDSSIVLIQSMPVSFNNKWIILNPLNIGPETNLSNNSVNLSFLPNDSDIVVDDFTYPNSPFNHAWWTTTPSVSGGLRTVFDPVLNENVLEVITNNGTQYEVQKGNIVLPRNSFSVDLKANANFQFYVECLDSASNIFYVHYTPDSHSPNQNLPYLHMHIGSTFMDGNWHTLTRNIDTDIDSVSWPHGIARIVGFLISGQISIGPITVLQDLQTTYSSCRIQVNKSWNLVSLPLKSPNPIYTAIFPTAVSYAFMYDQGYSMKDSLENGIGYWLKFKDTQIVKLSGSFVNFDTIQIHNGWNLIGNISVAIPSASTSAINTSQLTPYYGYNFGYIKADTLYPGKGYWVKFNSKGKLVFISH
ncbi:MAG: hypothetical protein ACHQQQ_00965 [Bacteroidota bacterium]